MRFYTDCTTTCKQTMSATEFTPSSLSSPALTPINEDNKMKKPEWYTLAQSLMHTREIPGKRSNPKILSWARAIGGWVKNFYRNDDIPWCGLFVAYCMQSTVDEPIVKNPLGARNWAQYGRQLAKPRIGAILVFSRRGGGHVGFYAGESKTAYLVLGGNQSNTVKYSWVAKSRLLRGGIRWPKTRKIIESGRVKHSKTGKLSRNEA